MNINFDEQYARMEMDIAYDNYLYECQIDGIAPMSFGMWKRIYMQSK